MKARHIFWVSLCSLSVPVLAQYPLLHGGLENRTQIFQNSIIVSIQMDAPFIPYAESNGSYLTSDILPFLLLLQVDTSTALTPISPGAITVFPNPVSDQLIIQRQNDTSPAWIELMDNQGREIRRIEWPSGVSAYQISMGRLVSGKYYVSILDQGRGHINTFQVLKL